MGDGLALRPARQERTRLGWLRILDAGLEILEERGFEGVTIAGLCERAAVTPPTIYARAPNKEALLLALYEHAMERITRVDTLRPAEARWRDLTPAEIIGGAVRVLVRLWLENARLLRAIVQRAGSDTEIFRRGSELSVELSRRFRAVLMQHPGVAPGPDRERRVDACFRMVYAAMVQRVVFGPTFESDVSLSEDELQVMLVEMVERFLQTEEER